jgi:mono/diheme cytochrome c family protein
LTAQENLSLRIATAFLFTVCGALSTSQAFAIDRFNLPEGPGRDLIYGHCQTCHDLQSVADSAGIRKGAWDAVLDNMRGFGLRISEDQRGKILDYLGTYLGPNPPAPAETKVASADETVDGVEVFNNTCIACHQEQGEGKKGEFPPLAGNPDVFLAHDFPVVVAMNGIEGKIEVNGEKFDNIMPPFDFLSDAEIAAVVNYVRSSWGNDKLAPQDIKEITAAEVANVRAKSESGMDAYEYRKSLSK